MIALRNDTKVIATGLIADGVGTVLGISHGGLLPSLLHEVVAGFDRAMGRRHPMPNTAFAVVDVDPNGRLTSRGWPA